MGKRHRGREIDGIVVLDKPAGISSNDAVQRAKRLYNARKVGHTGSLDPLATGVLPLCFGEGTKFSQFLLASDKKYWAEIQLGVRTDSGDADGEIVSERSAEGITGAQIESALNAFRGEIEQIPSMFSAIKHKGQPLYKLARQGIEVERKPRRVMVYENQVLSYVGTKVEIELHCSKGTYVRTIAEDLGEALGCGAHVCALRRTMAGPYHLDDAIGFEALEAARTAGRMDDELRPVASAVGQWPELELTENMAFYLKQGQAILVPKAPSSGWVQLTRSDTGNGKAFIGVGEILEDGRVAPRRLVRAA